MPAELCQQVLAVVRGLAKGAPLRSAALTGGRPWRTQREALDQVSCCEPYIWADAGSFEGRSCPSSAIPATFDTH